MRRASCGVLLVLALVFTGCPSADPGETEESREAFEARMREIEKRIKDSMPKTQEIALKQEASAEVVKKVQEQLNVLKEYQDEPTGKLDFVTVNAIQAFQRHQGLDDNGLLDEKTLGRLDREAKKVSEGNLEYFEAGYS